MKPVEDKLGAVIDQLAHNHAFQQFIEGIKDMRNQAWREASDETTMANHALLAGAVMRAKAMQEIIDAYQDRVGAGD